jgi:hypothetical protein
MCCIVTVFLRVRFGQRCWAAHSGCGQAVHNVWAAHECERCCTRLFVEAPFQPRGAIYRSGACV